MNLKWKLLVCFVVLYIFGVIGVAWHTFSVAAGIAGAAPSIETIKIVFIMLGGLGVILPTYLNVWQSVETANLLDDQVKRHRIENTIKLLEKWDDKSLFDARRFTRELGDKQDSLSPEQIRRQIIENGDLRQSVILLFNYFEFVRISIETDRVDSMIVREQLGQVFSDIYNRCQPWITTRPQQYQDDLKKLDKLFRK